MYENILITFSYQYNLLQPSVELLKEMLSQKGRLSCFSGLQLLFQWVPGARLKCASCTSWFFRGGVFAINWSRGVSLNLCFYWLDVFYLFFLWALLLVFQLQKILCFGTYFMSYLFIPEDFLK